MGNLQQEICSFNTNYRMESFFVTYKSSKVHYYLTGNGDKILLCFHGYGESGSSFNFMEKYITDGFVLIAIDFPFHGKTVWNEDLLFTPKDLLNITEEIIQSIAQKNTKIYLLGFSMGGRVALHLSQVIPTKIEKIILLAPDGLHVNFWYWFATQNYFGKKLFHFTVQHSAWFLSLLTIFNKTRLINQSIFKFTNYYLHDKQMRTDLFNRWITMRKFKPDTLKIKNNIRNNNIQIRLLYGEYDRVIRYTNAKKFMRGIESYCTLSILHSGHQLLQEKNEDAIIRLIKD
jgi:pimeloyl-ACP methyl ester carboxylesterase